LLQADVNNEVSETNETDNLELSPRKYVRQCTHTPEYDEFPANGWHRYTSEGDCTGRVAVIRPANGSAGFGKGNGCSTTQTVGQSFYITGCFASQDTLTIYTDATKSVIEQVIPVEIAEPNPPDGCDAQAKLKARTSSGATAAALPPPPDC
jgi:hypothetical protein